MCASAWINKVKAFSLPPKVVLSPSGRNLDDLVVRLCESENKMV